MDGGDIHETPFKISNDTLYFMGEHDLNQVYIRVSKDEMEKGKELEKLIEGEWTLLDNKPNGGSLFMQYLFRNISGIKTVTFIFKDSHYFIINDLTADYDIYTRGTYRIYGNTLVFKDDYRAYTGPELDLKNSTLIFDDIYKCEKSSFAPEKFINGLLKELQREDDYEGPTSTLKAN